MEKKCIPKQYFMLGGPITLHAEKIISISIEKSRNSKIYANTMYNTYYYVDIGILL